MDPCHSSWVPCCATSARPPRRSGCRPTPPATVRVLDTEARTFEVAGHHYALVQVTGLEPDSRTSRTRCTSTASGSGRRRPARSRTSLIRTRGPASDAHNRIIFGSCRYPKVAEPKLAAELGIDALDAYAARMSRRPAEDWPDALLLLGDQVYADELTPQNRRRIAGRRDRHPDWPDDEIVGFDEYVGLYQDSWTDPEIRWLLSVVPTAMIFDDHDVRDDWNTSATWRAQMQEKPWWRDRIRSAMASYWVYQHLGNLVRGRAGRRPGLPEDRRARRGRVAAAGRAGRPRRRRGRRRQGRAVQLPLGPRAQPVPDDRLAERPAAGERPAPDARRRRVPLDRGAGRRTRPGRPPGHRHLGAVAAAARHQRPGDGQRDRRGPSRLARAAGRGHPPGRRPGALAGVPRSPSTGSPR